MNPADWSGFLVMNKSPMPEIKPKWNAADATILLVCLALHIVSGLITLVALPIATDLRASDSESSTRGTTGWVDAARITLIVTWFGMTFGLFVFSKLKKPSITAVIPMLYLLLSLASIYAIVWFF